MNELTPMRKGRKSSLTKGRQLEDAALDEVKLALAGTSLARDLLIENLHKIQDMYGCIEARHIRALAEIMRIGQAEIYEVASFYDHFDVIREDEEKPAPLTIRVCDSLSCMMNGAEDLIANLSKNANPDHVRVLRAPCMGRCANAPAARIGDREVDNASTLGLLKMAELGEFDVAVPDYIGLHAYQESGGYQVLDRVRANELTFDMLVETLGDAGLRGLGGAGFPAGKKWGFVKGYPGPRLMTINGDEGEPGTFKDRYYLESDPHRMFEGAIIAAHAVEAERIYLYMRDEYPAVLEILRAEIAALEDGGIIDKGFIELRRGAGAYICGEESAMIESIEGKRGLPRHRPPYIAEVGLFGRPTLNHNVETLWWIRDIVENGPQWFAEQGKPDHPGIRSWSVSGRVKEPGVKLAPAGITVRELIDEYCGGMADGLVFKAYLPGGASGGVLPASMDDIPLDFGDSLFQHGAFVGSHAVVILSDQDNIKDVVINLINFFAHESCGQCTPCRGGTEKLSKLLRKSGNLDEETIRDLEQVMRDASICGLGQAAPNPVNHLLTHFREDL
ncbi:NADH-ubiquinone oxidoreductase-F iron-sulfur binding region domain-containing protein [Ahrensia marina]|uniref:NADH-quinone oxidoreductase subunit F n=1 Tax=Ahrensia marina TaxID=1514904 RepID=A0A0N0VMN9_9HYPH|nr:NADH-ubiquinone oxidoreductase-F iron-sulfur binding region domain-containing protein [Ahrensia marina]KPB02804.1 NADH-quinone oxidoreductase subunit F [Ahrensia marina]